MEKGRLEGLEGGARVLARQLVRRFGPLPDWAKQRLGAATEPDLDLWTDAAALTP